MNAAMTRAQRLEEVLQRLTTETPDVLGAAIVSRDGLLISRVLPTQTNEGSVGGMASILLNLGIRVSGELDLGGLNQVMVNGQKGSALMVQAGEGALLMVIMRRQAALGLIFLDVSRAAEEIERIL